MKKEKTIFQQLCGQFFYRNKLTFGLAAFSAFFSGFGGLIISWLLKQLIDTASGTEGAKSFETDLLLFAGFLVLMVISFVLDYITRPAFIRRAMTQYKNMAFDKLMDKGISTFRDESTATYLSALTNDATSIEANYLSQLLSLFTMSVMFFGSITLMLWYSPLFTAVAVGVTILPLSASILTGKRMVDAEKKVSDIKVTDLENITASDLDYFIDYTTYYEKSFNSAKKKEYKVGRENHETGKKRKIAAIRSLYKYLYKKEKINLVESEEI